MILRVLFVAVLFGFCSVVSAATVNFSGNVPQLLTDDSEGNLFFFNIDEAGDFTLEMDDDPDSSFNTNNQFRVQISVGGVLLDPGEVQFTSDDWQNEIFTFTATSSLTGLAVLDIGCGSLCADTNDPSFILTLTGDNISAVPLPAAAWLFLSVLGAGGMIRRFKGKA